MRSGDLPLFSGGYARLRFERGTDFRPHVIVPIGGGLGKQIWQYCIGMGAQFFSGIPVKYDLHWYERFGLDISGRERGDVQRHIDDGPAPNVGQDPDVGGVDAGQGQAFVQAGPEERPLVALPELPAEIVADEIVRYVLPVLTVPEDVQDPRKGQFSDGIARLLQHLARAGGAKGLPPPLSPPGHRRLALVGLPGTTDQQNFVVPNQKTKDDGDAIGAMFPALRTHRISSFISMQYSSGLRTTGASRP